MEPRLNEISEGYASVPYDYYEPKHSTYGLLGRSKEQKRLDKIERRQWNKKRNIELKEAYLRQKAQEQRARDENRIPAALNVPLSFWFCRTPELSIPCVAIPFGQMRIEVNISESDISQTGG